MAWFITFLLVYSIALATIQPEPQSLKDEQLSITENIIRIKATMLLGVILILVYFLISDFTFNKVNLPLYSFFSLNNIPELYKLWPMQVITHSFIHSNWIHLIMNVSCLALVSIYERRAGSKRFIAVYIAGTIVSIPSIFFFNHPVLVCGASGGIMALAAGYFTDYKNLTIKEWGLSVIGCFVLLIIFSIQGEINTQKIKSSIETYNGDVDHIAHILGAIGGIMYCRLRKRT